jgi:hypothetical protein
MTSGSTVVEKRNTQTNMNGPMKCSSLTLEREEHLTTFVRFYFTKFVRKGSKVIGLAT